MHRSEGLNPITSLALSALNPPTAIRLALESKGLTLRDVAARAGCDPSYVTQVIRGYGPSGNAVRRAISVLLSVETEDVDRLLDPLQQGGAEP
jgi:transcriptional regulator with XRE-family HTH domain